MPVKGLRMPNRILFATLVCAILSAPSLRAQGLTPEEIVSIEDVGTAALSPDGELVAYTLTKPRAANEAFGPPRNELWIVPAAGGDARVIVAAPNSASSPQWSPDGTMLAFRARLYKASVDQVYAVPASGGDPRPLTDSPLGVLSFAWSPDGAFIAYTAREPEAEGVETRRAEGYDAQVAGEGERHVRLWLEEVGSGHRRAVTPPDRTVRSFAWTPDGSGFALQITRSTDVDASYMNRQIHIAALAGGELQHLTRTPGKLGDMAWSPDGRHVAFIGAVSRNDPLAQSVFVVPANGGAAANLTAGLEASALSLDWLDDKTIAFVAGQGTRTTFNKVNIDRRRIERLAGGGAEIFSSVSLDRSRRNFAAAANTAKHPDEVYVGSVSQSGLTRITRHNAWLADRDLAQQETIEWLGADGWRIEGVLLRPLGGRPGERYPLAILPHGGPEGTSYDGWTTRALYPAQLLAANGYAVLMPNYRGSGGRGVAFAKGDHRDLGGKEFLDVIAGIDHLAELGLVDPHRVGISGTSYGGYFSAWAGTKYSERFKAAITYAGISNWISFTGTTDIPYEMSIVHWDTWWFDDPGLAWDRSPLAHINNTETAILVGHGLADTRVHPEQSVELHTALRIKGIPTGLVLYPREPHGLLERAHQLDFMRRLLKWFNTHLSAGVPATR